MCCGSIAHVCVYVFVCVGERELERVSAADPVSPAVSVVSTEGLFCSFGGSAVGLRSISFLESDDWPAPLTHNPHTAEVYSSKD